MKNSKNKFKEYTILVPMMANPHFTLIKYALKQYGYNLEILTTNNENIIQNGLTYVHNDMCYPALLVIGQFIDALKSGKYDLEKTALLLPQTGGGCRASNYIFLLRKALKRSGFENIPVLSLNTKKLDDNTLTISVNALILAIKALMYGDFIMCLYNQARSYEVNFGDSLNTLNEVVNWLSDKKFKGKFEENLVYICKKFADIKLTSEKKPRVGIVGEIYLKYSPLGNNNLEDFLISKGAEPVVSGVTDFVLYYLKNHLIDGQIYSVKSLTRPIIKYIMNFVLKIQKTMAKVVIQNSSFSAPHTFDKLCEAVEGVINTGVKMGEGWLLSAEIAGYIEEGINNVVCAQPFGCLPNHIVAKGAMANIRKKYPMANVVAIDYDPGSCRANQENRINLMLMNARKHMVKEVVDEKEKIHS